MMLPSNASALLNSLKRLICFHKALKAFLRSGGLSHFFLYSLTMAFASCSSGEGKSVKYRISRYVHMLQLC